MLFYVILSFSIIANILHWRAQAEVHALQDAELVFAGEPLVPWCHKPTIWGYLPPIKMVILGMVCCWVSHIISMISCHMMSYDVI